MGILLSFVFRCVFLFTQNLNGVLMIRGLYCLMSVLHLSVGPPPSPVPWMCKCWQDGNCTQAVNTCCGGATLASLKHTSDSEALFWRGHWSLLLTHLFLAFPQNKEKERMKESKDARYTNGHLFTSITVSGMTMCYACNKSITAKEALICPSE